MSIIIKKGYTNIHSTIDKEMFFLTLYKMHIRSYNFDGLLKQPEIDLYSINGISDRILNSFLDLPIIISDINLIAFNNELERFYYKLYMAENITDEKNYTDCIEYFDLFKTVSKSILNFFILKIDNLYYFSRLKKNGFDNSYKLIIFPIKNFINLYRKNLINSIFND
jgi:hypothetical protein